MRKEILVVLAATAVGLAPRQTHADGGIEASGIEVTPDAYGGLEQLVKPAAIQTSGPFVSKSERSVEIEYSGQWRFGCFVISPELVVNHDRGPARFVPEMATTWFGYFTPGTSGLEQTWVGALRVTRLRAGHDPAETERVITAADLDLVPYADTDTGRIYMGKRDNTRTATDPLGVDMEVERGDRVQLSFCNYGPATSFSVRGFFFHSYPRSTR